MALLVAGLLVMLALDPIPQDPHYHQFADQRTFFGIPNFNDVMSNAGFALTGLLGLALTTGRRQRQMFRDPADALPYRAFFASVALISLGSAWYHWAPSNESLFWDRLPMSMTFMALCAAVIADRINSKFATASALALLMAMGAATVLYWRWTESIGAGDLRFYAFVQFYPILLLPVVLWLFPQRRYTAAGYLLGMIGVYALCKVAEGLDHQIFALLGGTVSGHTLKHLVAAVATWVLALMLLERRALRQ